MIPKSEISRLDALTLFQRERFLENITTEQEAKIVFKWGTADQIQRAIAAISARLSKRDTGPDYDHIEQLWDGRIEMHVAEQDRMKITNRKLLAILQGSDLAQNIQH